MKKLIKHIYSCLFVAVLLIFSLISSNNTSYLKSYTKIKNAISLNKEIDVGHEKLKVENSKLVDNQGNQFIIHGINIGDDGNLPSFQKSTKTTYQLLKDEGFNTIRYTFPVTLFYDLENDKIRSENLEIFDQLTEVATDVGMYVIVDLHVLRSAEFSFNSSSDDYCLIGDDANTKAYNKAEKYKTIISTLWEAIASKAKGKDCILAYSLINEPYGGIDLSKITYISWEEYLNQGHTGSDWDKYVEEKTAAITKLQNEAKERIMNDYSSFLQDLINKIRFIDQDTTICFQKLANLCDVSNNYTFAGLDACGWSNEDAWPNITADNLLIDVNHIYDNGIYEYTYNENMLTKDQINTNKGIIENGESVGVLNMSEALNTTKTTSWYSSKSSSTSNGVTTITNSDFIDDSYKISGESGEKTCTLKLSATDKALLFGWGALYVTNNSSQAINLELTNFTIYKEINGKKVAIFNIASNDDSYKLMSYGFQKINSSNGLPGDYVFINSPYTINGNSMQNLDGSAIQGLKLGVRKNETIYIEFKLNATSSSNNLDATIDFQANKYTIDENDAGQDIITGYDLLEKCFNEAESAANKYLSPIYFGEFCLMSQYISDYTNFTKYTDAFSSLLTLIYFIKLVSVV